MNWLKENWFKVALLIILVISIASAFYWYEYRPMRIVKKCNQYIENRGYITKDSFIPGSIANVDILNKTEYDKCLQRYGLDK